MTTLIQQDLGGRNSQVVFWNVHPEPLGETRSNYDGRAYFFQIGLGNQPPTIGMFSEEGGKFSCHGV